VAYRTGPDCINPQRPLSHNPFDATTTIVTSQLTVMADQTPKSYHTDPTLYLYTSLTAGSSHIITATSRLSTILKANKIPFQALDVATDEKARMLWGRRAGKRRLPGLVRAGLVVGDLEEVEEWNEYGELKENVGGDGGAAATITSAAGTPSKSYALPSTPSKSAIQPATTPTKAPTPATETPSRLPQASSTDSALTTAMRQAGFEAAKKAGDAKSKARTDALDAAKAKQGSLEKLDNSGSTGMPPPSGTTEAMDAIAGESGEAKVEGKADEVPITEDMVGGGGMISATGLELGGEVASSKEVDESANKSISRDEEPEILEGKGQAELPSVPTADEAEAAANEAIHQDKSHIVLAGHGQTPEGLTPPNEKADHDEALEQSVQAIDGGGSTLKSAISATDEAEALPGTKTQEQAAASGEHVGDSVAD